MNVIEPKSFDVFHYADMAKTINHQWWTYGPVQCVGPNFLVTAMSCAGWVFHHIKPLLDSAKSIVAYSDPVPLKHGNRKWKRVIIVDGLTIYMGVLLFNILCSEYRLAPQKEIITERQFLDIFQKIYPDVWLYGLDDEEGRDISACAVGYWDANRILYSRSDEEIRMWRNYGRRDYRFKSAKEFEDWLTNARNHGRQFESKEDKV
ncbi:MAG: hypothetical protein IK038_03335 [Bacteroidaceae bacterium]|nr:hypothetical protein [Bacteroidaceae bacterium]